MLLLVGMNSKFELLGRHHSFELLLPEVKIGEVGVGGVR